ncbi:MAG: hypothetical protein ACP5NS_02585 [Candidatus Pacearchaeota archaeon]
MGKRVFLSRKIRNPLISLVAIVGIYSYSESWKNSKMEEDSKLFETAEMIGRSRDGNPKNMTAEEHVRFLYELGVQVPDYLRNFEGRATYAVDRSRFVGKIWVDINGTRIGVIDRPNLESYVKRYKK